MNIDRRTLLAAGGLGALAAPALAQTPAPGARPAGAPASGAPRPAPAPPVPPSVVIPLWPKTPPGGEGRAPRATAGGPAGRNIDVPTLGVYRPADPDGSAVIICPGGGYVNLSLALEGSSPSLRFNADRITCFVLTYRLPSEGWGDRANVPLQDAQRAMRIVRARAAEFGVDPRRIGIMGFSAGGHLAATLATRHAEPVYAAVDAMDSQPTKPAFAALIYPVITMKAPFAYRGGPPSLIGPEPTEAALNARSNELLVTADTAPCFLAHGMDDTTVPVENSLMMIQALRAQKIACEGHLFQEGRHGFGLGIASQNNSSWPELFTRWVRHIAPAAA